MLRVGDQAPDFELHDSSGRVVRLSDLLSKGPLLLYFYPADFTPICTREACMYRDYHTDLLAAGVQVCGVSPQASESHARFRKRHSLPFPLLSDPEKHVVRAYGAVGPLGIGVRRISYLIGSDGTIKDAVKADFLLRRHADIVKGVKKE